MSEKKAPNKAIVAVSLALVFVLLLVFCVFAFGDSTASRTDITLPDQQPGLQASTDDPYLAENMLLRVTPENAAVALESLSHPRYYHQSYSVSVGDEEERSETLVELWVNGDLIRAEIRFHDEMKVVLTDGKKVCLWYADEERAIYRTLGESVTFDDIMGLPAFDYLKTVRDGNVTDAEYLVLEDENQEVPCIFLSVQEAYGAETRCWISLSTGTLYEADCVENGAQVYHVKETGFDRLVDGDEIFADKFLRPDGAAAFTG